jgi:ribosome maturation factor RimP
VRLRQDFDDRIGQVLKVRISGVVEGKRQETGELILLPSGDFAIKTLTGPWPFKLENVLKAHLVYDWSQEKS